MAVYNQYACRHIQNGGLLAREIFGITDTIYIYHKFSGRRRVNIGPDSLIVVRLMA